MWFRKQFYLIEEVIVWRVNMRQRFLCLGKLSHSHEFVFGIKYIFVDSISNLRSGGSAADRSKAVFLVLSLFCMALRFLLQGDSC